MTDDRDHISFLEKVKHVFVEENDEDGSHEAGDSHDPEIASPRGGGDAVDRMFADIETEARGSASPAAKAASTDPGPSSPTVVVPAAVSTTASANVVDDVVSADVKKV